MILIIILNVDLQYNDMRLNKNVFQFFFYTIYYYKKKKKINNHNNLTLNLGRQKIGVQKNMPVQYI